MVRVGVAAIVVASGCYASHPLTGATCGPGDTCPSGLVCAPASDTCELAGTGSDGGVLTADAQFCLGDGLTTYCFATAPTGTQSLMTNVSFSTDGTLLCSPAFSDICLVAAGSATVDATLHLTGSRPLVILATDTIDVTASSVIDAASHSSGNNGPNADNVATCVSGMSPTGFGGGHGGSYYGTGGNGGKASSVGQGGIAAAGVVPTALHGGCGGEEGQGPNPAGGGFGGGAIELIAGKTITIEGTINASGARGGGAPIGPEGSGAGGGSGGMIVLAAPVVIASTTSVLMANGGGGGEGTDGDDAGFPGNEPAIGSPLSPAAGGNGASLYGGDGGAGAAGNVIAGSGGRDGTPIEDAGGGGGGGGAGYIAVHGTFMHLGPVSPTAAAI